MPFSPASKTSTPPRSSSRTRKTFMFRISPPRTTHTPSAICSGGAAASALSRRRERSFGGRAAITCRFHHFRFDVGVEGTKRYERRRRVGNRSLHVHVPRRIHRRPERDPGPR